MNLFTSKEQKNYFFSCFRADLLRIIADSKFKKNISNLLRSVDPDKIKITESGFKYTTREEIPRTISVSIIENGVFYSEEYVNCTNTGLYHVDESGKMYTKYTETDTTVYKGVYDGRKSKKYDTYNICQKTQFHTFNAEGIEIWRLEETNQDNYYQDKKTKEQIMPSPDCFENYTEKEYSFRAEDKIIKRVIKQYYLPECPDITKNRNGYLIGENHHPTNKRLPKGGEYIFFPKELFASYKLGECSINDLWENRGRVRVKS